MNTRGKNTSKAWTGKLQSTMKTASSSFPFILKTSATWILYSKKDFEKKQALDLKETMRNLVAPVIGDLWKILSHMGMGMAFQQQKCLACMCPQVSIFDKISPRYFCVPHFIPMEYSQQTWILGQDGRLLKPCTCAHQDS
jgi:hypothetical protein